MGSNVSDNNTPVQPGSKLHLTKQKVGKQANAGPHQGPSSSATGKGNEGTVPNNSPVKGNPVKPKSGSGKTDAAGH
jgi:hypothetical protein